MKVTIKSSRSFGTRRSKKIAKEIFYRKIVELWKDSLLAFLEATAHNIVVDTGMSIASLYPLAAKVKFKTTLNAISPSKRIRKGHTKAYGDFANNNAPFRSKALGERLGKDAYVFEFGTVDHPFLVFQFKIVVLQHFLNEQGLGNVPSPPVWQSLEAGREAFLDHWNSHKREVLDGKELLKYLTTGEVK
jgi:hypothetical protein